MTATILDAYQKVNTTLSGTGTGANLLPGTAPTLGSGVTWNSGTGTLTATAASNIAYWSAFLTIGKFYQVTFNYTMSSGSKIRVTNSTGGGVETVATSAVLGASGSVTLNFQAVDVNLGFEADTATFTGTISSIVIKESPALIATSTGAGGVRASHYVSGIAYFEGTLTTLAGTPQIGIASTLWDNTTALGTGANTIGYQPSGAVRNNNATLTTLAAYVQGDRIGVAIDPLNRLIWFRVNGGNWNNNVANDPPTGVGGIDFSGIAIATIAPAVSASITANVWTMIFSTPFTDAVPTGYQSVDVVGFTTARSTSLPLVPTTITLPTPGVRADSLPTNNTTRGKHFTPGGAVTVVSGLVEEFGVVVVGRRVDVYDRNTGELLGTAVSAADGSWSIPALGRPQVRVVGSDPLTFDSIVYDYVTPV